MRFHDPFSRFTVRNPTPGTVVRWHTTSGHYGGGPGQRTRGAGVAHRRAAGAAGVVPVRPWPRRCHGPTTERTYHCEDCGEQLDRDRNAAVNLARWPDHEQPPTIALACPSGTPKPP